MTNVGEGAATYEATMVSPLGTTVEVLPMTLMFQKKYDQQSYNVSITYNGNKNQEVSYGDQLH